MRPLFAGSSASQGIKGPFCRQMAGFHVGRATTSNTRELFARSGIKNTISTLARDPAPVVDERGPFEKVAATERLQAAPSKNSLRHNLKGSLC